MCVGMRFRRLVGIRGGEELLSRGNSLIEVRRFLVGLVIRSVWLEFGKREK